MLHFFQSLFEYDFWANSQVLTALKNCRKVDQKTLKLMAHILGSQFVWQTRLNRHFSKGDLIWPEWSIEDCQAKQQQLKKSWLEFLNKQTEKSLAQKVSYQNTQGQTFATPIRDILLHVHTHSSYHRGQIANIMRELGEVSLNTDYITYVRKFMSPG